MKLKIIATQKFQDTGIKHGDYMYFPRARVVIKTTQDQANFSATSSTPSKIQSVFLRKQSPPVTISGMPSITIALQFEKASYGSIDEPRREFIENLGGEI
jgi:hypothetical protein